MTRREDPRARRFAVLELLFRKGCVTVSDALAALGLKGRQEGLIRSDFSYLAEKLGIPVIQKDRGALRLNPVLQALLSAPFYARLGASAVGKLAIANHVVDHHVAPGDSVAFGGGSSVAFVAAALAARGVDLRAAVTNNLCVYSLLGLRMVAGLTLATGTFSARDQEFFGREAARALRRVGVSKKIVGVAGVSSDGDLMAWEEGELPVVSCLLKVQDPSERVVIVVDRAKLHSNRGLRVATHRQLRKECTVVVIDRVATDADAGLVERLRRSGLSVEVVRP